MFYYWNTNTHAFSLIFRPEMFETAIKESTSSSKSPPSKHFATENTLSGIYFAAVVLKIIARVAVEIKPGKSIQSRGCIWFTSFKFFNNFRISTCLVLYKAAWGRQKMKSIFQEAQCHRTRKHVMRNKVGLKNGLF